jgi:ribonuclease T
LALKEKDALDKIFRPIRAAISESGCKRAVLVGHNAHFDLSFLKAAVKRTGLDRDPFHDFSVFDTVTLSGVLLGQTALARALQAANLPYEQSEAHSALYDAERTADLFCLLTNAAQGVFEQLRSPAEEAE